MDVKRIDLEIPKEYKKHSFEFETIYLILHGIDKNKTRKFSYILQIYYD